LLRAIARERAAARRTAVSALSDPRYFALLDRLQHARGAVGDRPPGSLLPPPAPARARSGPGRRPPRGFEPARSLVARVPQGAGRVLGARLGVDGRGAALGADSPEAGPLRGRARRPGARQAG